MRSAVTTNNAFIAKPIFSIDPRKFMLGSELMEPWSCGPLPGCSEILSLSRSRGGASKRSGVRSLDSGQLVATELKFTGMTSMKK